MKLKMAKNSLFAVLLRSPWWISLALVISIAMGSRALLPAQYVLFGVLGGLPFLVIGSMAAWRQWRAPNPARVAQALAQAGAMSWRDFSLVVEQGFGRQGYQVSRLNGAAADFELRKAERTTLVSCKRWKAASHGVEALRELLAAQESKGAHQGIYISLGGVTSQASRFAQEKGLILFSENDLAQLLTP